MKIKAIKTLVINGKIIKQGEVTEVSVAPLLEEKLNRMIDVVEVIKKKNKQEDKKENKQQEKAENKQEEKTEDKGE